MKKILLSLSCGAIAISSHAQLSIGATNNIFITSGTQFITDSLLLIPSVDLNLTTNLITKTANPAYAVNGPGNSLNRVYNITNAINFTGTVGLKYRDSELAGNPENLLQIAFTDTQPDWTTSATSTVDQVNNIVSLDMATSTPLRRVTATQIGVVLPLSVTDFRVALQPAFVVLNWKVSDNKSFTGFNIQSSTDGRNWQTMGRVNATETDWDASYSYQDINLDFTVRYYRLSLTSRSNEISFTPTLIVRKDGKNSNALMIEQSGNSVNFRFSGAVPEEFAVYDMNGRTLMSNTGTSANYSINTLTPGVYIARYHVNGIAATQRFVIN